MAGTMKDLEQFTLAVSKVGTDAGTWPPPADAIKAVHFERSTLPGHIRIYIDGAWYDLAAGVLMNAVFALCPYEGSLTPTPPPRPTLRPIRPT